MTYTENLKSAAASAILLMGKMLNGRSYSREDIIRAQNRLADAVRADGSFICDSLNPQSSEDCSK